MSRRSIFVIHGSRIKVMKCTHAFNTVVSADAVGIIEYWDPNTLQFPDSQLKFKYKSDADLFTNVKCKTAVSAIE
ncbi:hypothetical protein Tco_0075064, partial [Tanacetum coccineum]